MQSDKALQECLWVTQQILRAAHSPWSVVCPPELLGMVPVHVHACMNHPLPM